MSLRMAWDTTDEFGSIRCAVRRDVCMWRTGKRVIARKQSVACDGRRQRWEKQSQLWLRLLSRANFSSLEFQAKDNARAINHQSFAVRRQFPAYLS